MDFLKNLRSAVGELKSSIANYRDKLEQLKRKREDLNAAPTANSDLIAWVLACVDAEATKYPQQLQRMLTNPRRDGHVDPDGTRQRLLQYSYSIIGAGEDGRYRYELIVPFICAVFPDQVKAAMRGIIMKTYPEDDGLPAVERLAVRQKLDAQIDELEQELAQLRDEASAAGVAVRTNANTKDESWHITANE